jgi:hypothetical protein
MNGEKELSKSIRDHLNKTQIDMHFKFIDSFCDIADEKSRIYIEVKLDHFAPRSDTTRDRERGDQECEISWGCRQL